MTNWTRRLVAMGACADAVAWAKTQSDLKTAWATCQRGDWMLWLAGRCVGETGSMAHRLVVLAACGCARLSLARWTEQYPNDARPRQAIEAAELWAATGRDKRAAAAVASAASAAADASAAAASAASAAASSASAAASSASAAAAYAAAASSASAAAVYAAAAAAAADTFSSALAACADIVRGFIPKPPKTEKR